MLAVKIEKIFLLKETNKKLIEIGDLEIEYMSTARYSGRFNNKRCFNVKNIKKLIIPIPVGKWDEIRKYINRLTTLYLALPLSIMKRNYFIIPVGSIKILFLFSSA
jgi:hypothetical protein